MALSFQLLTLPFASSAPAQAIPNIANPGFKTAPFPIPSQAGITQGAASLTDGFPLITMEDTETGGVPPYGQDMNGALYLISSNVLALNAGQMPTYNLTIATNVGGYKAGALLATVSGNGFWVNTAAGNTSNPDTGGANWIGLGTAIGAVITNPISGVSQSIAGALNVLNAFQVSAANGANVTIDSTAAPTDEKLWVWQGFNNGNISLIAYNDAATSGQSAITISRVGAAISAVAISGTAHLGANSDLAATPATADNSTKIATTAWARLVLAASPALGGTPTAVTNGTATDASTQIATDQFVQAAVAAALASAISGTIGANGSITMKIAGAPHGQVILKYGFHTPGTNAGAGLEAIAFPVAFPNNCYFAGAFSNRAITGVTPTGYVDKATVSVTGFSAVIDQDASGNRSALWLAIGD